MNPKRSVKFKSIIISQVLIALEADDQLFVIGSHIAKFCRDYIDNNFKAQKDY